MRSILPSFSTGWGSYLFPLVALLTVLLGHATSPSTIYAASPLVVNSMEPLGLQSGATTRVILKGSGFTPETRLHLPVSSQQTVASVTNEQIELDVVLPADVATQLLWCSVINGQTNSSDPRLIGIEPMAQRSFAPATGTPPVALSGTISGNQVLETTIELKAGQRCLSDLQSRRLGSNLQPLLRVLDPQGKQVASSSPVLALNGDARCIWIAAIDGTYRVTINDLTYQAPNAPFRLRIGDLVAIDASLPAARQVPTTTTYPNWPQLELLNASADAASGAATGSIDGTAHVIDSSWSTHDLATLPKVDVPNKGSIAKSPALPVVVYGTSEGKQKVSFLCDVVAGQPVEVEVWSNRLGTEFDPRLRLRAIDGRELASSDDTAGTLDSVVRWPGQADIAQVIIEVDSATSTVNAPMALAVHQAAVPQISATIDESSIVSIAQGWGVARVDLVRNGYAGAVRLQLKDQAGNAIAAPSTESPAKAGDNALAAPPIEIAAGEDHTLIAVRTSAAGALAAWLKVDAIYGPEAFPRVVPVAVQSRAKLPFASQRNWISFVQAAHPWLQWQPNATPNRDIEIVAGVPFDLPTPVVRNSIDATDTAWQVAVSLKSTQILPRKNPADPNSPIETQQALNVSPNLEAVTAERPLGAIRFLAPSVASDDSFRAALQLDLIEPQSKRVIARLSQEPFNVRIVSPVLLSWSEPVARSVQWGKGEQLPPLRLTVVRRPGVVGPIEVKLLGFPESIATSTIKVESEAPFTEVQLPWPDLNSAAAGTNFPQLSLQAFWASPANPKSPPAQSQLLPAPTLTIK